MEVAFKLGLAMLDQGIIQKGNPVKNETQPTFPICLCRGHVRVAVSFVMKLPRSSW